MTIKWPLNLYRELLFAELFHNQYCRLSIGVFLSSFTSKTNASLRGPVCHLPQVVFVWTARGKGL